MGGKKKHQKKERRGSDEEEGEPVPAEKVQQTQGEKEEEEGPQVVAPKKVSYCPVCSLTFELCKYGKQALQCASFLFKLAPTKVNKYHPDFKPEQLQDIKPSKTVLKEEQQLTSKGEAKVKTLKDKYIVIDVKNRGKKHYVTTVSGLNNFNVDCKDLSKKCSKKFAVSCSVTEVGTVQLQGDNFETMRDLLLSEYKQLKKKYILEKQDFNEKLADEKAKNKEAKKLEKNAIKQEPEEEEKPAQVVKNPNMIRLEMMKKAEEELDEDDE